MTKQTSDMIIFEETLNLSYSKNISHVIFQIAQEIQNLMEVIQIS